MIAFHKKLDPYEKDAEENLAKRLRTVASRMHQQEERIRRMDRNETTSQDTWTRVGNTQLEDPEEEDQPRETYSSST